MSSVKWEIVNLVSGDTSIRMTNEEGVVWSIPQDETNTDYQRYLEWVAAGNEPEVIEA